MAFLDAFNRKRRSPMDERLPDGRSVYKAVADVQNPQVLTPQNQQVITRPRTVTPQAEPAPAQQQPSPFVDAFTRPRRTQERDYLADDSAYLRDLNRQPRGWRGKLLDIADAANAVAGGPKRVIPSKHERQVMDAERNLGQDIELQKQELNQMVPVTLDDGSQVMVPRRSAGTLQSNQQNIRARNTANTERTRMNSARIANWNAMSDSRRQRLIADLYKSGGLNDPEMLEYAADQLGIPAGLREKFVAGQMRDAIDENGQLVQINRQTQEVSPTGVTTYEKTKEAGRNRRATEAQAGANQRAAARGTTTGGAPKPDRAAERRAANLIGTIERARGEMVEADKTNNKERREAARLAGEQAAAELNALNAGYEAGPGEKGYPYYKQRSAQAAQSAPAGRTIEGAIEAFTRKVGRAPTQDEINKMKAALGQQ